MPIGVYEPLRKFKGLPSDEEISDWCLQLRLCLDAVVAEAEYNAATNPEVNEDNFEEEMTYYDDQMKLYQDALSALRKLVRMDMQGGTPQLEQTY